jgi:uncharacterized membrane protein
MIEEYLARLRAELAGADPAVIHDATYDADEYFRAELADVPEEEQAEAMARAEEDYGAPAEVAAAYRLPAAEGVPPSKSRALISGSSLS